MNELRERYKELLLESARIAVRGGVMSLAFEDFLIDHIDELVDGLSDRNFNSLLSDGKQQVKPITNDDDYVRYCDCLTIARTAISNEMNIMERRMIENYIYQIEKITQEYERWNDLSITGMYILS